ncbi:MAG: GNAT family N-acetyltransferase [Spirochaetales bacterium]|nr:GNAT family N-acetyltransferase [Spirochaetales bacterium]
MHITIRSLDEQDMDSFVKLSEQLGYTITAEKALKNLECCRNIRLTHAFVAADEDGKVVGWIQVGILPLMYMEPTGDILGLVVDERHRCMGIGKVLIRRAESWLEENGIKKVKVSSNEKRSRAHGFYKRNGYELVKTQCFFMKDL